MGPRRKPLVHGPKKKASGLALCPHVIGHHSPGSIIQLELRDSPNANNQYKDPSLSVRGPFPKSPKAPTRNPLELATPALLTAG